MKRRGIDSKVVADLLGDSSTRMVDLVYGQLDDATYTSAVALLPTPPTAEAGNRWVTEHRERRSKWDS